MIVASFYFTIPSIFALLSSIAVFFVAMFVLFKNTKSILHILFFLFSLSISGWLFGTFKLFNAVSDESITFWDRFIYGSAVFISVLLYHFGLVIIKSVSRRTVLYIGYVLAFFFLVISQTDYFTKGVFRYEWGAHTIAQFWHHVFLIYFTAYFLLFFANIYTYYKKQFDESEKIKLRYILIAFAILFGFGPFAYLPAYEIPVPPFPFMAGTVFSLIIAYAITKHHLFDIQTIIRLGTIYGLLFGVISFVFVFIASLVSQFISGWLTLLLPSLLITLGFMPLKNFIETTTDSIFFRKKYKVEDIIKKLNTIVHTYGLHLDEFLENFNRLIVDSLRVERAAILVLMPKGNFISRKIIGGNMPNFELKPEHPIIQYFKGGEKSSIDRDVLQKDPESKEIINELDRLGFSLVVPIEAKSQLIGLYLIGRKKSQDPFTKEEIDLLQLLASESGASIDNARLFDELKKLDQIKSKFISVASHQLRTPLTSIHWNIELALQGGLKKKTAKELLEHAYRSTLAMANNFDDMFTALDIEEGKINLAVKKEQTDFGNLVQDVVSSLLKEAKKKEVALEVHLPEIPLSCAVNKEMIRRVLTILVHNAILYSHPKTTATIVALQEEEKGKNRILFSISDQGIGIGEPENKTLFTRFYRSEGAMRLSPDGFGLGLFIAKHFIEAHGGRIWFVSEGRGMGTVFFLALPLE